MAPITRLNFLLPVLIIVFAVCVCPASSSGAPGPDAPSRYSPAAVPALSDAKKAAALKTFMEVFNKCTHDAAVTIQSTNYEASPPEKITQYNYYRNISNFRTDTIAGERVVKMVVSESGPSWMAEKGGAPSPITAQQTAEMIAAEDLGSMICKNINSFDLKESKDKNNNILIYLINKKSGYMITYVIDSKLKTFKRVCVYPQKDALAIDSVYGPYKFGKIDDKAFAPPPSAK